MHSSEVSAPAPAAGPALLQQLGRMVLRGRSRSPAASCNHPSTSQQVQSQPRSEVDDVSPHVEAQLAAHVNALWTDHAPLCIEVSLAPRGGCAECAGGAGRRLLLERWTMRALTQKPASSPSFSCAQWLVNALRSQLHFSQLSAWLTTLTKEPTRRRKLSRETCNIKKLEANCDDSEQANDENLNIVYTIRAGDNKNTSHDFTRPSIDHTFPLTDIGNDIFLKVTLESLPRLDEIPKIKCTCPKRRHSKDNTHEEIIRKINDLTLGGKTPKFSDKGANKCSTEDIYKEIVDDRMLTPCSENGKHKCSCDDESDTQNHKTKTQETKKIDENRLKEIAKYKRRIRKEYKLRKLCDSTSSECDKNKETHTSIPILQASRFDRLRAIGCYRNQTYLTLPATRIEYKSPFTESINIPPNEFKKTNTIATQTDDLQCLCGSVINIDHNKSMIKSEANYNLADKDIDPGSINDPAVSKKHICDIPSISKKCDIQLELNDMSGNDEGLIKRPKLRRLFPIVDRIERIVSDRFSHSKDIEELHLKKDDSVFSTPKETKRQKTFSISDDDYVLYEKSDYGTYDRCELESPNELTNAFKFPEAKHQKTSINSTLTNSYTQKLPEYSRNIQKFPNKTDQNALEMSKPCLELTPKSDTESTPECSSNFKPCVNEFSYRYDPVASKAFHSKTGLPLTSSPAPMRRGSNSFDFDDSINGVSGIKSALYPAAPRAKKERRENTKIKYKPSRCLLGSFEESLLQGRLPGPTAAGFLAELCCAGAGTVAPHARLPVSVTYCSSEAHAPYMGHIDLGPSGYRVPPSGTIQLSLFNPHGTLVKMFCVKYELSKMPPRTRTFLRQRTYYVPAQGPAKLEASLLRYLIHLRFMTSKSGKIYLHTDIRLIVSRKADLDTATAHSAIMRSVSTNHNPEKSTTNHSADITTNDSEARNHSPNRVFGGCDNYESKMRELGYENQNGVAFELRSFTYAPENPKYSPR